MARIFLLDNLLAIVAARDGIFLVQRNDIFVGRSMLEYGEYSGLEMDFLKRLVKPDDVIIEVGANIGSLTVGLAKAVGRNGLISAFEPQRSGFALLNAQIALNQLQNVHAHRLAVGSAPGRAWVPVLPLDRTANFGGHALLNQPRIDAEPVDVVTLDNHLDDIQCDLIKIDVEGMEEAVLRGATKLIAKHHPLLYVENDRADRSHALITLLFEMGYRCYWHVPKLYNPNNCFGRRENVLGNYASCNMFCARGEHPAAKGLVEIKSADAPHPVAEAAVLLKLAHA
jgi:FkbM family methyltransferase